LILRNISKIDATRCQVLRLKCTKFDFRYRALSQTQLGELTVLLLAVFKGLLLRGGRGRERERKGRIGEGRGGLPSPQLGSLDLLVFFVTQN